MDVQTFEPVFNPAQTAVLLGTILIPFGYWWFITVPEARLLLSKDKRKGELNIYLKQLKEAEGRPVEQWFFQKWLAKTRPPVQQAQSRADRTGSDPAVVLEEFSPIKPSTDEAESEVTLLELFRPASKKGNPTPRFFSGDNPIVVTTGTLMAFGIAAAVVRSNGALALDLGVLCAGLAFGLNRLVLK
eukprot:CAMPEP_0119315072 /NCGR_PEP_ID=MMETSP1333-20130426/34373_1 /TAXON_ID=418940 /ORGANISM="Scyphosphaera apsteinii, Strain RCC1455" /LENGTH=186 /DNA_ID=CAMNT_0007320301 /DNA_START=100 /DNA_END=660 /DNA_ORIENTATION=-